MSIRQAAICSQIYYPTAKAIHKIYIAEKRIDKKLHRFRKITPAGSKKTDNALSKKSESVAAQEGVDQRVTMLKPIREELDLGYDIYESLDEGDVDVTEERITDARQQNMPFDHFRITKTAEEVNDENNKIEAEALDQNTRVGGDSAANDSLMDEVEPACLSSATGTGLEGQMGNSQPVSLVSSTFPQISDAYQTTQAPEFPLKKIISDRKFSNFFIPTTFVILFETNLGYIIVNQHIANRGSSDQLRSLLTKI